MYLANRKLRSSFLVVCVLICRGGSICFGQNITGYDTIADPLLFLLREPAVHADLRLAPRQRQQITDLNHSFDPTLMAARTWPAEKSTAKSDEIRLASQQAVAKILTPQQKERLHQISYRVRGIRFIILPQVSKKLELTDDQTAQCTAALQEATEKIASLRNQVANGELAQSVAESTATDIREAEQKNVLGVLTDPQKQQVIAMVGASFDASKLGRVSFLAPEIESQGTWINSPPLHNKDLQGKVVVVHFWTFGCSNCIQNFRWYREWQNRFADKELVILGVHTPETAAEYEITNVRNSVKKEGFSFPVVVDNDKKIWDAWGNGIWPSVYLVDKKGQVRYWWYGELNWKGAGGQTTMAKHIQELLDEAI